MGTHCLTRKFFTRIASSFPTRLFPTTICLRVSRIIFDAESLLNKFTRAQIFNATVEFLLFAVHRFSEISRALYTHSTRSRFTLSRSTFYNVKIVIALSTQLVRFLRGTSLSEVVFASKSSFYPA